MLCSIFFGGQGSCPGFNLKFDVVLSNTGSQFMATFCSGCKEEVESVGDVNRDAKSGPAVHEFGSILEGLAGCVACGGNSTLVSCLHVFPFYVAFLCIAEIFGAFLCLVFQVATNYFLSEGLGSFVCYATCPFISWRVAN